MIPNAVDGEAFYPPSRATEKRSEGKSSSRSSGSESSNNSSNSGSAKRSGKKEVTIVVSVRLTYRKGIHLLAKLIPLTLKRNKNVRFIIAGSGPMECIYAKCVKKRTKECKGKVEFLGDAKHENVPNILRRGIFFELFVDRGVLYGYCRSRELRVGGGGDRRRWRSRSVTGSHDGHFSGGVGEEINDGNGNGRRKKKTESGKTKRNNVLFFSPADGFWFVRAARKKP